MQNRCVLVPLRYYYENQKYKSSMVKLHGCFYSQITCKNETIDILQTDLIDCQQQYANCLQQVAFLFVKIDVFDLSFLSL